VCKRAVKVERPNPAKLHLSTARSAAVTERTLPEHLEVEEKRPGDLLQDDLYRFALAGPDKALAKQKSLRPEQEEVLDLQKQVVEKIGKNGEWELIQSEKGSAADHLKMDFILRNKNDGRAFFIDPTLRTADMKAGAGGSKISRLHRDAIFEYEESDFHLPTLQSKKDFLKLIVERTKGEAPLSSDQLPAYKRLPLKDTIDEMTKFRRTVQDKARVLDRDATDLDRHAASLESQAKVNTGDGTALLRSQAQVLKNKAEEMGLRAKLLREYNQKLEGSQRYVEIKLQEQAAAANNTRPISPAPVEVPVPAGTKLDSSDQITESQVPASGTAGIAGVTDQSREALPKNLAKDLRTAWEAMAGGKRPENGIDEEVD